MGFSLFLWLEFGEVIVDCFRFMFENFVGSKLFGEYLLIYIYCYEGEWDYVEGV